MHNQENARQSPDLFLGRGLETRLVSCIEATVPQAQKEERERERARQSSSSAQQRKDQLRTRSR